MIFCTVRSGSPALMLSHVRSGVNVVACARADAAPRPGARQGVGRRRQRVPLPWQNDLPMVRVRSNAVALRVVSSLMGGCYHSFVRCYCSFVRWLKGQSYQATSLLCSDVLIYEYDNTGSAGVRCRCVKNETGEYCRSEKINSVNVLI